MFYRHSRLWLVISEFPMTLYSLYTVNANNIFENSDVNNTT